MLDGHVNLHHLANMVDRLSVAAMRGFATRGGDTACFQITFDNFIICGLRV